ncbi:hypothetical protein AB0N05_34025 [Nocardia sp. NPDC051030]|uniref:alpha/beta fold hydrolase n=1 Tax=Nocardia sp. NPDC051030 TaxID=3155162 RepID=UPI003435171E
MATRDLLADWQSLGSRQIPANGMPAALTDLRGSLILEGAGHWIQQQRPAEVNAALIDFAREIG